MSEPRQDEARREGARQRAAARRERLRSYRPATTHFPRWFRWALPAPAWLVLAIKLTWSDTIWTQVWRNGRYGGGYTSVGGDTLVVVVPLTVIYVFMALRDARREVGEAQEVTSLKALVVRGVALLGLYISAALILRH